MPLSQLFITDSTFEHPSVLTIHSMPVTVNVSRESKHHLILKRPLLYSNTHENNFLILILLYDCCILVTLAREKVLKKTTEMINNNLVILVANVVSDKCFDCSSFHSSYP